MARTLVATELRAQLASPERVRQDPFGILASISTLLQTSDQEATGREMVLRALEWRDSFGTCEPILDSLARIAGLYPFVEYQNLDLRDSIAYEYHRPADLEEDIVFHREQAEVYRRLYAGESLILSAPTSFGKSRIIDAMIATRRFANIAIVVPTLALIDETRRRLAKFSTQYKIVTHLTQPPAARNIFVFTAERVVAYERLPRIDFFAIDEFYKIGAITEDESRTVALNEAFYRLLKGKGQFYLLGPNIQRIPEGLESAYRCYFYPTSYSTVVVETSPAPGSGRNIGRLMELLRTLSEPTLVFCSSPGRVNEVARAMLEANIGRTSPAMRDAAAWIAKTFHPDWVFGTGLTHGIGIHHGRLPRSLSQFVVRAFNANQIQHLICTSTLIEGVNTRAKNVVIWDNTISQRPIDFFTFNNIKGRSGRMFEHFVGRVYLFDNAPQEELSYVDFPVFTQDSTAPATLLIQLDERDLLSEARDRVERYSNDPVLSLTTLRSNRGVDPDSQINLARHIESNAQSFWPRLAWRGFPQSYDQLKFVCELIWTYLVNGQQRQGVFSGSHLAFKTHQLYQTPSTARRVQAELRPGRYAARSADEAVERVLQFDRSWAGFQLPKCLMAVSRIQQEVLTRAGLPSGDYSAYAAQVESLFRAPIVAALDEYGIPIQVGERIRALLRTNDDLDEALRNLRTLNVPQLRLGTFEAELVKDAQAGL